MWGSSGVCFPHGHRMTRIIRDPPTRSLSNRTEKITLFPRRKPGKAIQSATTGYRSSKKAMNRGSQSKRTFLPVEAPGSISVADPRRLIRPLPPQLQFLCCLCFLLFTYFFPGGHPADPGRWNHCEWMFRPGLDHSDTYSFETTFWILFKKAAFTRFRLLS